MSTVEVVPTVKLSPEQKAAAREQKAALKAAREQAEKAAAEAAAARRATLHDAAIPLLVTAAQVDDDASVKSSPLYGMAGPRIVDLRETFIPYDAKPGWATTGKAANHPQYRTLIKGWYQEVAEKVVPIPPSPENPGPDASEQARDDFEASFAAYSAEVEPMRIRQNHLISILPNRVQYHVERELVKRYGQKPKPIDNNNAGNNDNEGRNEAGRTGTKASQDFERMSVGQAPKHNVDPAVHAQKLTAAAVAFSKLVDARIPEGIAARSTLVQYVNQAMNALTHVSDALIASAPEAEQAELRAKATNARRLSIAVIEANLRALLDAPAEQAAPAAPAEVEQAEVEPTDAQLDSVEDDAPAEVEPTDAPAEVEPVEQVEVETAPTA